MKHKHIVALCLAPFFFALVIIAAFGFVWFRYGLVRLQSAGKISFSAMSGNITVTPQGTTQSQSGIIIFPANLVDASQYVAFAQDLSGTLHEQVIILRPSFRLAINSQVADTERSLPDVRHWTYVGHSAGAAAACKIASGGRGIRPVRIIAIAGYCRNPAIRPVRAYLAQSDRLVSLQVHRKDAVETVAIRTSDHFFMTSRASNSQAYTQLTRDLLDYLQNQPE